MKIRYFQYSNHKGVNIKRSQGQIKWFTLSKNNGYLAKGSKQPCTSHVKYVALEVVLLITTVEPPLVDDVTEKASSGAGALG